MQAPESDRRGPLEEVQARVMFALTVLFLVLLAGLFHRHREQELVDGQIDLQYKLEFQLQVAGLALLWPVFIVEGLWRFSRRERGRPGWGNVGHLVLVCLIPPLRIGAQGPAGKRWLPVLGWRESDRDLRRKLEQFFSVPMIVIALMVVPLLAIEWWWGEEESRNVGLALFLAIANAVIWFAFAIEFLVMVSVAERRVTYCVRHWVDLAIILLPMLEFLPLARLLRLSRILRLEQLTRMGRLYRLRGLLVKAWRAMLLLELIQRLTGRSLEKRLQRLQDLLAAKEEEIEDLRKEIDDLRKQIAERDRAVRSAAAERPCGEP